MIKTFAHKGLNNFFYNGTTKGIQAKHAHRLRLILDLLDAANVVQDMDFPGSGLHSLKGKMKDFFSVKVSGNWRIVFKFEQGNAFEVNYTDYH